MPIEFGKLDGHFTIARDHVEQADHGDDGGVGRAQEQEKKDDADEPAERDAQRPARS